VSVGDAVPVELRSRDQWVVWKVEQRGDKPTKVPYQPTRPSQKAKPNDPRTWGTFEQAIAVEGAVEDVAGVGYVFSPGDPFAGVDLDKCIDAHGEMHPAAAGIVARLDSYSEPSPSRAGMHTIVEAELRGRGRRTKSTPWGGEFEVYDRSRFFTVTGLGSGAIAERQEQFDAVVAAMFASGRSSSNGAGPSVRNVEELLAAFPELARLAGHRGKKPKDDSASGWDFWLACQAIRSGLSKEEIAALIRHARRGDFKGERPDYLERTIAAAREGVERDAADPAALISRRWNLGGDPVVGGELLGGVIVRLTRQSGAALRIPKVDDLFDASRHTRIVSVIAKTRFAKLTAAEAVEVAQAVIALCPGDRPDPCREARGWVTEFIAHSGVEVQAVTTAGCRKSRWEVFSEFEQAEQALKDSRDAAGKTAIIRDREKNELWLPAGALKEHSGSRADWDEFTAQLGEVGWRSEEVDVREPASRAARAAGEAQRVHRNFYVGVD
jgi:hypothetical protein